MLLDCKYAGMCPGCAWIKRDYLQQKNDKMRAFCEAMDLAGVHFDSPVEFHASDFSGTRDRVDLIFADHHYGFTDPSTKKIFPIEMCLMMSASLQELFRKIQNFSWPIKRGSLRLRTSPEGVFGVWLDFANLDILSILKEQSVLKKVMEFAILEVGQRHKRVALKDHQLKLIDPELSAWSQTLFEGRSVPLYGTIGSFSQAGHQVNFEFIKIIQQYLDLADGKRILEFGSGNGNLTFPALEKNRSVICLENSQLAVSGLKRSLKEQKLDNRSVVVLGDFQNKESKSIQGFSFTSEDVGLFDPPRSGLLKFLEIFKSPQAPAQVISVSCYLKSFVSDSKEMQDCGYKLKKLSLFDFFPHTPHFEIISFWQR